MNLCTIYISIITRIQNSNTLVVSQYPSTRTHHYCIKRHHFVWILLKKVLGEDPYCRPPPPSNTTLSDSIIHINTEKINIKTFQQLNTLYYMKVCKTLCKTWKARSCPLYLTLALTLPFFCFFKKIVVVENKYSVLNLSGNKFSSRARDENKYFVPTKSSESNGRPLTCTCVQVA